MGGTERVPVANGVGPYQADTRIPNPSKTFEVADNYVRKVTSARDALRGASIGNDLVGQMRAHPNQGPGFEMRIPLGGRPRSPTTERAEAELNRGWRELVQGLMRRNELNGADYDSWLNTRFRLSD